jgi:hypothetical protein
VTGFIRPPLRDDEGVAVLGQDKLVLLGRAEQHAWLEALIKRARETKESQIDVSFGVFGLTETSFEEHFFPILGDQGNEERTRAVLAGSDETDEWLERVLIDTDEQMSHPRLVARPMTRVKVGQSRQVTYIKDFDVEKASVANPIIGIIRDGFETEVLAAFVDDSMIALDLLYSRQDLVRPIPTFKTTLGVGQPVTIQLPEVRTTRLQQKLLIPDGGLAILCARWSPAENEARKMEGLAPITHMACVVRVKTQQE